MNSPSLLAWWPVGLYVGENPLSTRWHGDLRGKRSGFSISYTQSIGTMACGTCVGIISQYPLAWGPAG